MFRWLPLYLAALSVALASARAADGWAQLKAGMSPQETYAALGAPLLRTTSRGLEVWIYSDRAEVMFRNGPVFAWTAPAANPISSKRPISADVTVLPGGIVVRTLPVGPRSVLDRAYETANETRFRYNARRPR